MKVRSSAGLHISPKDVVGAFSQSGMVGDVNVRGKGWQPRILERTKLGGAEKKAAYDVKVLASALMRM